MNLLMHAKVALDVVGRKRLSEDERNMLVLGSIIPDMAEFGVVSEEDTHTKGSEFARYAGSRYKYFSIGMMLHGEKPYGLDYYTHHGYYQPGGRYVAHPKPQGILAKEAGEIRKIIYAYRKSIGKIDLNSAIHMVTEMCFDHLTFIAEPKLADEVYGAIQNPVAGQATRIFANFFDMSRKNYKRVENILHSRHIVPFMQNFATIEGTAHNFHNFVFFKSLRDYYGNGKPNFAHRLSNIAKSSFSLLRTKLHDKSMVIMFERCVEVVRKDYIGFVAVTERNMKKMAASRHFI